MVDKSKELKSLLPGNGLCSLFVYYLLHFSKKAQMSNESDGLYYDIHFCNPSIKIELRINETAGFNRTSIILKLTAIAAIKSDVPYRKSELTLIR